MKRPDIETIQKRLNGTTNGEWISEIDKQGFYNIFLKHGTRIAAISTYGC